MVVMATCQQSKKTFGITAQKVGKDYVFKWAFKLNRESAQHEGFDDDAVKVDTDFYLCRDFHF